MTASIPKQNKLFPYLLLLTGLFLCVEIGVFVQWANFYLGSFKHFNRHLAIPNVVLPDFLSFTFIQLSIHFLFTVLVWATARLTGIALNLSWKKIERLGFVIWGLGIITALFANAYFFPNSRYACFVSLFFSPRLEFILLLCLSAILLVFAGSAIKGLFNYSRKVFIALCIIIVSIGVSESIHKKNNLFVATNNNKPNIILIGVDSLRPDFLGYFGDEQKTPHIDEFLNQSTVFTEAMTPLARTSPAWISLLTGKYPKHNGVRTNLANQAGIDYSHTMPAILRKRGYETLFATDESRFSNIDFGVGFNKIISPPMGINDLLLGTLNDFPFSNFLNNTYLGHFLFPHSYANRAVFTAYDPATFSTLLSDTLKQTSHRPLFLAVHFCLPHFPYFWGTKEVDKNVIQNYRNALVRVDQQFNDFLTVLNTNHLLDNTIVVMLSDHGEAMALSGDRATDVDAFMPGLHHDKTIPHFYPANADSSQVNQSVGHGTDVLGLTQYHVVLAFRLYNHGTNQKTGVSGLVSLLDIKPTILSFLHMTDSMMDGRSLAPFIIKEQTNAFKDQDFFTESDFSPDALRSIHPKAKQIFSQGADFFQVDQHTARVFVKKEMMEQILLSKQYADFYRGWVLALYPQDSNNKMMPILLNLKTGEWSNDLRISFAQKSPAVHMLNALRRFYGQEIGLVVNS